jgi:predicted nucleotidyltransferase component of viral defense system
LALVEKDLQVVRAIRALAELDSAPFTLVFGGGTALARAHKIVQRMSEDVDFKIVPGPGVPASRGRLRQQLAGLREQVTAAFQAAGFAIDAGDGDIVRSRNENRYMVYQLPYRASRRGEVLRPTIQIELTYATLRLARAMLPISSFVAEAFGRAPEVPMMPCVSATETAAEKVVSLTRRTAMDLAGLSHKADPALIRHIYDLHLMSNLVDHGEVAAMAKGIAVQDALEFRNQYPAYYADIAGETQKALNALSTDPLYRERFTGFVAEMVYGVQADFDDALSTVMKVAKLLIE